MRRRLLEFATLSILSSLPSLAWAGPACDAYQSQVREYAAQGVKGENLPSIHLVQPSSSRTIVLIHGLGGTPGQLLALRQFYESQGLNTVTVLLSGHGTNPEALLHVKRESWTSDVKRATDCASELGKETYLSGFSLGGALAIQAAHDSPGKFKGLFLFAPSVEIKPRVYGRVISIPTEMACELEESDATRDNPYIHFSLGAPSETNYGKVYPRAICYTELLAQKLRDPGYLESVHTPIFSVTSEADEVVETGGIQKYLAKTTGPRVSKVYPQSAGIGHWATFDPKKNPDYPHLTAEMANFLKRTYPSSEVIAAPRDQGPASGSADH